MTQVVVYLYVRSVRSIAYRHQETSVSRKNPSSHSNEQFALFVAKIRGGIQHIDEAHVWIERLLLR